ncbi:MAG: hypothetical protein SFU53_10580 [Terrimicrobiaceae bacterium]|nr:hypothetical protein [Terrimicrobiaceae bacterium]
MNKHPISPAAHGCLDYLFGLVNMAGPSALRLHPAASVPVMAFGLAQIVLNAVTDQPYAIRRNVSLATHRKVEKWSGPVALGATLLLGGWTCPRTRAFLAVQTLAALGLYHGTDWNATADAGYPSPHHIPDDMARFETPLSELP